MFRGIRDVSFYDCISYHIGWYLLGTAISEPMGDVGVLEKLISDMGKVFENEILELAVIVRYN